MQIVVGGTSVASAAWCQLYPFGVDADSNTHCFSCLERLCALIQLRILDRQLKTISPPKNQITPPPPSPLPRARVHCCWHAFRGWDGFQEATVADESIPDHKKADICRRIAEADRCLIDGSSEELQLLDLASVAMRSCRSQ